MQALAQVLFEAINEVTKRRRDYLDLEVAGLENQLVNEVALSSSWELHSSWTFKKQSHINILEEASLLRLAIFSVTRAQAFEGGCTGGQLCRAWGNFQGQDQLTGALGDPEKSQCYVCGSCPLFHLALCAHSLGTLLMIPQGMHR